MSHLDRLTTDHIDGMLQSAVKYSDWVDSHKRQYLADHGEAYGLADEGEAYEHMMANGFQLAELEEHYSRVLQCFALEMIPVLVVAKQAIRVVGRCERAWLDHAICYEAGYTCSEAETIVALMDAIGEDSADFRRWHANLDDDIEDAHHLGWDGEISADVLADRKQEIGENEQ